MDKKFYYGTGRRKASVARVRLTSGTGKIIINKHDVSDYMPSDMLIIDLKQPLTLTEKEDKFDCLINVQGGGFSGQAGAIRLGIARALKESDEDLKAVLKSNKMLTRDSRIKERKKPGLKGARRAPQFSKR